MREQAYSRLRSTDWFDRLEEPILYYGSYSARSDGRYRYVDACGQSRDLRTKGLSLPRSIAQNFSTVGLLRGCREHGKSLKWAC